MSDKIIFNADTKVVFEVYGFKNKNMDSAFFSLGYVEDVGYGFLVGSDPEDFSADTRPVKAIFDGGTHYVISTKEKILEALDIPEVKYENAIKMLHAMQNLSKAMRVFGDSEERFNDDTGSHEVWNQQTKSWIPLRDVFL